jgi:hypothetical protein
MTSAILHDAVVRGGWPGWRTLALAACLTAAMGAVPGRAGVAVSPLKQEITVKPGETGKVTITLSNHSRSELDAAQSVRLDVVDVQASEDGSILFKEVGMMDNSASRWISLSRAGATLDPNASETLECTVTPPPSTPPGEYYSAVMVTMATRGQTDRGVVVQYRIASGIFVTIPGRTFAKQARISRCEFVWPEPAEAPSTRPAGAPAGTGEASAPRLPGVSVLLQNIGKARFEASGKVKIVDGRSRIVFSGPLNTKRSCVFGGDSRLFEVGLNKPLPAGKYVIKVEMDYESTWSKARYELPVEILPEQAAALAQMNKQYRAGRPPVDVQPEKIMLTVRPGAMRSLGLSIRGASDGPIRGRVGLTAAEGVPADSWLTVSPGEFAVAQSGRKTISLRLQVPGGTAAGTYCSMVSIKAGPDGAAVPELKVPVEIEVKTER